MELTFDFLRTFLLCYLWGVGELIVVRLMLSNQEKCAAMRKRRTRSQRKNHEKNKIDETLRKDCKYMDFKSSFLIDVLWWSACLRDRNGHHSIIAGSASDSRPL